MLYARIVVALPVAGPFDYIVPDHLESQAKPGMRAWVDFGNKKTVGFIVGVTRKTKIKKLKKIEEVIDKQPLLGADMLSLTRQLSEYYSCSWGEAIAASVPEGLRKGKTILRLEAEEAGITPAKKEIVLLHDLAGSRWEVYLKEIKEALAGHKAAIILCADIPSVLKAKERIASSLGLAAEVSFRKQPRELESWLVIASGKAQIVVGTRSAIFAPLNNPGLIIIDEEQDPVYKQDQVPHYHARTVALMRAELNQARLILGATAPSLESYYLVKQNKAAYRLLARQKPFPEIKIVHTYSGLSRYLQDTIYSFLSAGNKTLLFLNRRGFATFARCFNCQEAVKCPRCNINLVYHFKLNFLNCHYCNFKAPIPKICPRCNAGYIRFSGIGTEKMESELSRIYPQARIKVIEAKEDLDIGSADIFVSTSSIIKKENLDFDLVGVLAPDNSLNRIDFRAGEKTHALLIGLLGLCSKQMVIQTMLGHHHIFASLIRQDPQLFYDEELKERRQLAFPPFRHLAAVKLRAKSEERVKAAAERLFHKFSSVKKIKGLKLLSLNKAQPAKLRGNFYWQILISSESAVKIANFLKINLKNFPHSGIIVTVDVDPV